MSSTTLILMSSQNLRRSPKHPKIMGLTQMMSRDEMRQIPILIIQPVLVLNVKCYKTSTFQYHHKHRLQSYLCSLLRSYQEQVMLWLIWKWRKLLIELGVNLFKRLLPSNTLQRQLARQRQKVLRMMVTIRRISQSLTQLKWTKPLVLLKWEV